MTHTSDRPLFRRAPRLRDIVPFVPLADGLPTPVEQLAERLWVQRDDLTSSRYGGNKVRKFEFVLPIAARRGGPILTAGGVGSHHVLAAAIHAGSMGLEVEAVRYPQHRSDDVAATASAFDAFVAAGDATSVTAGSPYTMPAGLARRLAALAPRRPTFVWPGASTPLGALGHVSAGLELVEQCERAGLESPDDIVVALGSGSTAVGLAIGVALGGWRRTTVVAVRITDWLVTNGVVLRALDTGTRAVLAAGGVRAGRGRIEIDGRWLGEGYAVPTDAGDAAAGHARSLGLVLEPTYTAKAFAAALARREQGSSVLFVQTYAGEH